MILQQLFESSPGGSDNYAENLAQTIFDKRQDISSEEEVLNQAYHIVANDMGQKTARYKFSYDEDFPSDVVSNYFHLQKQGVTEDTPRVDSLVTDALKIMRGAELNDAVQALKTVLGDREYNSRRGFYNFYVRQLIDMYGKKGVAEGSGPKEKQKTPYRDINSPEYRAAADKQKQRMAKDKAAEPGKKMLAKQGVAEGGFPKKISQKEVDKFQKKHNDKLTGREVNRQEQEKKPADNTKKQGVAEGSNSNVYFEVDSENAYNHVMKKFGSVIEWDGDAMVAPRKYWGAIQELAYSAGGEANEVGDEQGVAEGSEDRSRLIHFNTWTVMDSDEVVMKHSVERDPFFSAKKFIRQLDDEGYEFTHVISPEGRVTYLPQHDPRHLKNFPDDQVDEGEKDTSWMNKQSQDFYNKNPNFKRDDRETKSLGNNRLATRVGPTGGVAKVKKKPMTPFESLDAENSPVASAITRRILMQRSDLLSKYGPVLVTQAIDEVADFVGDVEEIGSSDVSGWIKQVEQMLANNPPEAFDKGVAEGRHGYDDHGYSLAPGHDEGEPVYSRSHDRRPASRAYNLVHADTGKQLMNKEKTAPAEFGNEQHAQAVASKLKYGTWIPKAV